MTIAYLKGDATDPIEDGNRAIVAHVCNNLGRWGRGFVVALSKRWPLAEESYLGWADEHDRLPLGEVQFVAVEPGILVANMIAQDGLGRARKPLRLSALRKALTTVAEIAREGGSSIHMPRIGCGLAGGNWGDVEPVIEETCHDLDVYIYDLP